MRIKEVLYVFILCLQIVLSIVVLATIFLFLLGVRTFLETTVGQTIFLGIGIFSLASPTIATLLKKREGAVHFNKNIEKIGNMLQTIIIASGVVVLILMVILKLSS